MKSLVSAIKQCRICADELDHEPRPIVQLNSKASILIAGQAPGRIVHDTGIAFNDLSGSRLRDWMGVSKSTFYDAEKIALLPMGFCYPGQGNSGDLAPRKECAITWRQQALDLMPDIKLILVIGTYAMKWHLGEDRKNNLTETVRAWQTYPVSIIPLPHPSPRNNRWLKKNAWFECNLLPVLRSRVNVALN
jgi:uracil-DNA glycosylase